MQNIITIFQEYLGKITPTAKLTVAQPRYATLFNPPETVLARLKDETRSGTSDIINKFTANILQVIKGRHISETAGNLLPKQLKITQATTAAIKKKAEVSASFFNRQFRRIAAKPPNILTTGRIIVSATERSVVIENISEINVGTRLEALFFNPPCIAIGSIRSGNPEKIQIFKNCFPVGVFFSSARSVCFSFENKHEAANQQNAAAQKFIRRTYDKL